MTTELNLLFWTLVFTVVHILLTASLRTREAGLPYIAGPRDVPPLVPPSLLTARLVRAQSNLLETLPVFIGIVLLDHVANIHSSLTHWGAMMYFWGRIFYVPLYAMGIPYLRTAIWAISLLGILMLHIAFLKWM